ncbi:3,4-dihydroxy-2-butanone 4-phosphate synthase [Drechmeria coniospora]|uniref:3,4-dihydroxy-2-butanone 4-phosphate synthase n=1 Tax=Drechmeria coniospora TaxID=98403 RepID=A0A151GY07_DRECN|nr:3,4-dihydroxy-2-butanone 4-phosphate synthase [Drechmeria coniospora]KYK61999.1 3,4-dihydroxy-2-butanone 4-phosphate synthase [Drechmeria coniospora]ODA79735.1 hypothetical protein RJ55_05329 [Drechmeria coniospora]
MTVSKDRKPAGVASIEETIGAFARGEFVIVFDSHGENEGDLMIAAEDMTSGKMAFMVKHTSGFICAPIPQSRADELGLPLMVKENADPNSAAFSVTVDGVHPSISTGISAEDRARTCRLLADPASTPMTFGRPGHILPLRAVDEGIRRRQGHTEAVVELCRLAGKHLAGVLGEMVLDGDADPDGKTEYVGGRMMIRNDCLAFGKRWGIKVCTMEDLVAYVEGEYGQLAAVGSNCPAG